MLHDSAFGRLSAAWQASSGASVARVARERIEALARRVGLSSAPDLNTVVWLSLTPATAPPPAAVTSLEPGRRNFRLHAVRPGSGAEVELLLRTLRPRLLVADVEWCAAIGLAAIRQLHRHAPQVDWLLCWDEPSPLWLEAVVSSGARGAVSRAADPIELARAFDAVLAGELWMPRRVLQWLCATVLEAPVRDVASTTPSSSLWPADSELTQREAEVAALLRQGLTNREIGERLAVSVNTVKKHVAHVYEKQGIRGRRQTTMG
jgi:DNA-binding NarL/FixJ family response regulator